MLTHWSYVFIALTHWCINLVWLYERTLADSIVTRFCSVYRWYLEGLKKIAQYLIVCSKKSFFFLFEVILFWAFQKFNLKVQFPKCLTFETFQQHRSAFILVLEPGPQQAWYWPNSRRHVMPCGVKRVNPHVTCHQLAVPDPLLKNECCYLNNKYLLSMFHSVPKVFALESMVVDICLLNGSREYETSALSREMVCSVAFF